MAFDAINERYAMVNFLVVGAPASLPEAEGAFSAEMGAMMVELFPVELPAEAAELGGPEPSSHLPPRMIAAGNM